MIRQTHPTPELTLSVYIPQNKLFYPLNITFAKSRMQANVASSLLPVKDDASDQNTDKEIQETESSEKLGIQKGETTFSCKIKVVL